MDACSLWLDRVGEGKVCVCGGGRVWGDRDGSIGIGQRERIRRGGRGIRLRRKRN